MVRENGLTENLVDLSLLATTPVVHDIYDEMGCHVRCFPSKCLNLSFKSKKSFICKLSFNQDGYSNLYCNAIHCWYYLNLTVREEGNSVTKNENWVI